ncbi:DoxX family protein [Mycobacterium sp. B14F4]|uniref:DoxX family protein n=1 Tax=Mycobacterium sp. B14F4 TaxID=3153565 RepID=UPI00325DD41D
MATSDVQPTRTPSVTGALQRARTEPAYGAFLLLRIGFSVLPIVFGLDKFTDVLTRWDTYLAPWIVDLSPLSAQHTMLVVGVIEIVAGLTVAIKPRYGAYLVAAWLAAIIVNLVSYPGFYDVALRDFGLLLGALTLARLATVYDPARGSRATR